ncbi:MAG: transcription antitermination factor NusB [Humibacillus sp.]|nr:transcription antitermination factor NusB [Humibacillus sp.]MDN5776483.1 transcription antitermination factor NusB [Humibacillus sp.]
MAARTKARSRALDILFEADQRGVNAQALLDERLAQRNVDDGSLGSRAGNNPYTAELVRGVTSRWGEIDAALTDYSQGWTLDRMPAVDRAILRLGAWEVLWNDEIPDAVAISEAVGLATEMSTDDSPAFVNGLLGRLAEVKATIV